MLAEIHRAARLIVRDPATSLIAVVTLALAVGATTAVIGVANAVLLDTGVLAAASAMALLVGLLAGLTPALQAARQDPLDGLKDGGRPGTGRAQLRLRGGLVAIEAALVTVLLVGAGLLLDSFVRLTSVGPGFDPAGVVTARIELEPSAASSGTARVAFFDTLLTELRARPEVVAGSVASDRLIAALLSAFGALALVVAAVGVYGLVASSVASRTRELGIRLAVGARGTDLVRQVVFEVLVVAGIGVAVGMLVSLLALGALGELLYQTEPTDPLILASTAAFLLAVVALAGLVPAWRTTRIDPSIALSHE